MKLVFVSFGGNAGMSMSEDEFTDIYLSVHMCLHTCLGMCVLYIYIYMYGATTSWEIDGETVETVPDFIFLGPRITADGDCSHKIKKTLTPWKESYDQPRQHIEKQKHYFANKGPSSQAMVFPVVMYGCESWTVKKAER